MYLSPFEFQPVDFFSSRLQPSVTVVIILDASLEIGTETTRGVKSYCLSSQFVGFSDEND